MIKNIVFDIGNVLAGFDYHEYMETLDLPEDRRKRVTKAVFEGPYWKEMDRGVWEEEEICTKCISLAPEEEAVIRQIFQSEIGKVVQEYSFAADWLKELHSRGYRIYLLSNYGKRPFAWAEKHFSFIREADDMIISYREQLIKPDPEIYRRLLDRFALIPAETVFLDDTLVNVEAAKNQGIHGIHVSSHQEAVRQLETLLTVSAD